MLHLEVKPEEIAKGAPKIISSLGMGYKFWSVGVKSMLEYHNINPNQLIIYQTRESVVIWRKSFDEWLKEKGYNL